MDLELGITRDIAVDKEKEIQGALEAKRELQKEATRARLDLEGKVAKLKADLEAFPG